MSYLGFHLRFNLPVLLALACASAGVPVQAGETMAWGTVLGIVMVFTSPWDNWAAKEGIWGFPREKFTWQIGWLPVEEYLFFILQSLNVMLSTRLLLAWVPSLRTGLEVPWSQVSRIGLVVVGFFIAFALVWRWKNGLARRFRYAWHLLFWLLPVVGCLLSLGWTLFPRHAGLIAAVTFFWGAYYTVADLVAVRHGVWHFDETQITGWKWAGVLPWEEIAFFCLTSLLVVMSYLLLLPAASR